MSKLKYYDGTNWKIVNGQVTGDTLPIGSEVDFDGQEVPAGWQEITNPDSYSTTEVKTNKTWIDGKPIYRKIVVIDELPDNGAATYSSGITDSVDKMLNITGTAMSKTTFLNAFPLPYIDKYSGSNNNIEIVWLGTSKEVRITTDTNRTTLCAYIFLEYTKTTD